MIFWNDDGRGLCCKSVIVEDCVVNRDSRGLCCKLVMVEDCVVNW